MNDSSLSELSELNEYTTRLYRDLDFNVVKEWKRNTGKMVIGYMPVYIPREILHAMDILAVGIMGGGDDLEIIRGDAYYQSYICHIPRSTVELGLTGRLDVLDGMLFPAICDVIRNLSGMWKMMFPDKLSRYIDFPQNFDDEIGGEFYTREIEELVEDLEARGAKVLTPENLSASIRVYNHNRDLISALYAMRAKQPWKIPTHELYLLLRAGLVLPVEEHSALLTRYQALVQADESRRPMDQARILLTGSFCEQPPLGLIKTLERSGCYIVDDDFVQVHRWLATNVREDGDPMKNLVDAFLHQSIESPTRYIADQVKGKALADRAMRCQAEGVLYCAPSFCDPALLDQPMTQAYLDKQSIPWTAFRYAENNGQFQVIREQAGTFADSIKLWSEV